MKKDETKKTRPKTAAVNKKEVFEKMAKTLKGKLEKTSPLKVVNQTSDKIKQSEKKLK